MEPQPIAAILSEQTRVEAEIARLDLVIDSLDKERKGAKERTARTAELTQPWSVFIRRMRLLTAQSWGSRVQNYLKEFYTWNGVAQNLNRGDARVENDDYVEIKVTIITGSNTGANFVQIRPFQAIAGYRMFIVDPDYKVWRFDLTKEQMAVEIKKCGNNAHQVEESAVENPNREYAIRFKWATADTNCARWLASYLVSKESAVTPDLMNRYSYEHAKTVSKRLGHS